jgi:hypothetical protein
MNAQQLIALFVGGVIVAIGTMKIEIIKEIARKVTSDKEKVNLYSFLFLGVLVGASSLLILYLPTEGAKEPEEVQAGVAPPVVSTEPGKKSDLEAGIEAAKYAIEKGDEWNKNRKTRKQQEDSIFLATRPTRWVYQLGSVTNDEDVIHALYKGMEGVDNVKLFRHEKKYFLFKEDNLSRDELVGSIDSVRAHVGDVSVSLIDLMAYCETSKARIIQVKSVKFGRRKEKVEIACYAVDR